MMKLLYIDLFCGAGGTSTGVENARYNGSQCAKVIACVNHDANAIASHAANHPDALHFTEDIRTLGLSTLTEHVAKKRDEFPESPIVLWASLECTNFSKAKGGQPRNADSRTLAEHLFRYIDAINPDYIQIENVEEFMSWGDLDENGKPISKDKGRLYVKWVNQVKCYGYQYGYRILNAADYGAYTSRKRFFGIFAKQTLPIIFPEQTHSKKLEKDLFNNILKPWKPVREVLDFTDEGESIFSRKKPLANNTLERIYAGLIKFVAGGKDKFEKQNIDRVSFLSKYFSGRPDGKNISVEEPAGVITTIDHHSFISAYYGNGHNHSINEPSPTVTTKDRLSLVSTEFIDQQFGTGKPISIEKPLGTITTIPKYNMISCKHWIMSTNFSNIGSSKINITVEPTDSLPAVKIKEFMALYMIVDIKMRMLRIPELKQIMGFKKDYVLMGSQTEQKKFIGNAVEVNMARVLCESLFKKLIELKKTV